VKVRWLLIHRRAGEVKTPGCWLDNLKISKFENLKMGKGREMQIGFLGIRVVQMIFNLPERRTIN
jgi:hypothetical protein